MLFLVIWKKLLRYKLKEEIKMTEFNYKCEIERRKESLQKELSKIYTYIKNNPLTNI
ncbi:hypothetical protein FACS189432_09210 [Bacteroidia bacterium]|nr:hypothetical protein FACS189432_09210 [Bacteroidia bacterium]GHV70427.1 hypothetical protein FACS189420_1480 [Bacteroidia bacterium]